MHNIGRSYPRRILRLAALGAPIVYLFGAMLCGLWGANGEQVWAQEAGQTEYWVEYAGKQYKYVDLSENYFRYANDNQNFQTSFYIGFDQNMDFIIQIEETTNGYIESNIKNGFANDYWSYIKPAGEPTALDESYSELINEKYCFTGWSFDEDYNNISYYEIYVDGPTHSMHQLYWYGHFGNTMTYGGETDLFSNDDINPYSYQTFGDAHLYEYYPLYQDLPIISGWSTEPNINIKWHSERYNQNYTDGIFGNFFPRENFLVKWGENALSNNPAGFSPFGAFFKYIDDNITHFKNANQQIGLMAYGYLYYVAHVLIADMALLCITFIPKLLDKINDKILGGLDND